MATTPTVPMNSAIGRQAGVPTHPYTPAARIVANQKNAAPIHVH